MSKVQWAVRQSGRYLPATPIPSAQVRQSFVPPMRDEEHEIHEIHKSTKGDTVAVNLQSNRAPVAVGTAWLSSEDMYMAG